jgi:hypothetical protein
VYINTEYVSSALFVALHYCCPFAVPCMRTVFFCPITACITFTALNPALRSALRESTRKGKVIPVLNQAQSHENFTCTFNLGTRLRWVISFTPRPLNPQGMTYKYLLYRRSNRLHSLSISTLVRLSQ